MWRFIKFTLATILLAAIGLTAYFAWIVLTPVTAENVESRLARSCALTTSLAAVAKLAVREEFQLTAQRGQCSCAARHAIQAYGAPEAARIGELIRTAIVSFGDQRQTSDERRAAAGLLKLTASHLQKCPHT